MNCWYTIICFVYLFYSSIYAQTDWSKFEAYDIYPAVDKSNCVFPFLYKNKIYNDCTTDGDNGNLPWCSISANYSGVFSYCYDFWNSNLRCLPTFSVNGKNFDKCDYLSKTIPYKQCRTNHTRVRFRYCIEEHLKKSGKPLVRMNSCDPDYKSLSSFPTMCIGPSDYAIQIPITATQKTELLEKHNEYRSAVSSRYMFKLYWDDELAKLAQARADLCGFDHDLAANRLSPKYKWKNGQNMVMSTEIRSSLASLLDMMLGSEKVNFRYGSECSPNPATCLHYTQAMLSNLTRVGCAHTHCLYPDRIERYLVCNYIQSQYQDNYNIPYVPSDAAAIDCPSKKSGNLCDCGDKICDYNAGEYIEPNTCDCKKLVSKRSIEKRDVNYNYDALYGSNKPMAVIPNAKNLDLHTDKKRSFKIFP